MRAGIFVYDDVEPIDLATFGVLSMARRIQTDISICTIAPSAGIVTLANGLRILADHGIDEAPELDVLVVTGGPGWIAQAASEATRNFIRRMATSVSIVSVCTGAMILAASGVLDGRRATTKRAVVPPEVSPLQRLRAEYPRITAQEAVLIEDGNIVTGGGVTLCIDAMFNLLRRQFGDHTAAEVARIMEYQHALEANRTGFATKV